MCAFVFVNKFNWDADLREDRQFHLDYPGACTISTEQVPPICAHFVPTALFSACLWHRWLFCYIE